MPRTARCSAHRRIRPYAWPGVGAVTLGIGVALVGGTAVANADTGENSSLSTSANADAAPESVGPKRAHRPSRATSAESTPARRGLASWVVSGFSQPFAGRPEYERYAPRQAIYPCQINVPLGSWRADKIAKEFGLDKSRALTPEQYRLLITGQGVGGQPAQAKLIDESIRILTNTTGRPLYANVDGEPTASVLASYGLMVTTEGLLQSVANESSPTRMVNLTPDGYLDQWCRDNQCEKTVVALDTSAFRKEALFVIESQDQAGYAQLVPNQRGTASSTVGISMAPSVWIVNFCLLYMLNPKLAALMPAYWTPIPSEVAQAIEAAAPVELPSGGLTPGGQVPYSQYASLFRSASLQSADMSRV